MVEFSDLDPSVEVGVDHVGSVPAAAKVIAVLHQGENRLVCDSRIEVEELSAPLHGEGVETYVAQLDLPATSAGRPKRRSPKAVTA